LNFGRAAWQLVFSLALLASTLMKIVLLNSPWQTLGIPSVGVRFGNTQASRTPQYVSATSELGLFRKIKFEQIFSAGNADVLLRLEIPHLQGCTGNFFHCRCHTTSRLPILQFDQKFNG